MVDVDEMEVAEVAEVALDEDWWRRMRGTMAMEVTVAVTVTTVA